MRYAATSLFIALAAAAVIIPPARAAETLEQCEARAKVLDKKAEAFKGDKQIRLLILADLKRSRQEAGEGDAEECTEALDHAEQLLAGKY